MQEVVFFGVWFSTRPGNLLREGDRGRRTEAFLVFWTLGAKWLKEWGLAFHQVAAGTAGPGGFSSLRATGKAVRVTYGTARRAHLHQALCPQSVLLWGPLKCVFIVVSLKIIRKGVPVVAQW